MFVLQNCRGNKANLPVKSPGYVHDAATFEETTDISVMKESSLKEPDIGDYIIFHATLQGSPSYRHTEDGSLLVQTLCKSLKEYPEEDVLTHSTLVLEAISQMDALPGNDVQVCEVSHTLRKRFVVDFDTNDPA